jgi:preprotein translocase subunit SecF
VADDVRVALARLAGISPDGIDEKDVGPTWGSQISAKALQGLLIFLVLVGIYIALRFEWKMAAAALIALTHDLVITAGIFALVGREVTPAAIIAILTILGYSLYDTVVIFDKIKENTDNIALVQRETYGGVVNLSLNQTLMRSVNTSLVVLLPIGSLLLFGGQTLKDFAFALFVGVACGTYSSIFVASPSLVVFKEREQKYQKIAARATQRASRPAAVRPPAGRPVRAVSSPTSGNGEAGRLAAVPGGDGAAAAAGATTASRGAASTSSQRPARPAAASGGSGGSARKKSTTRQKPKRRRR